MRIGVKGPRVALLAFLIAASVSKLLSGYQPHYAISHRIFAFATLVEIVLIFGLLIQRLRTLALIGVGVIAAVGIAIAILGDGKTCGCLGSMIRLTSAQHILMNATVGALAVVAWYCEACDRLVSPESHTTT